jgi:hypothetical protein
VGAPGELASWITAFAALIALIVGIQQYLSQRKFTRWRDMRRIWDDYLRLCFENPEYSYGPCAKVTLGGTFANINSETDLKANKYTWFLSIMLNVCEQLVVEGGFWIALAEDQVRNHAEGIKAIQREEWTQGYHWRLRRIIARVLKGD